MDGTTTIDQREINTQFKRFYEQLYRSEAAEKEKKMFEFLFEFLFKVAMPTLTMDLRQGNFGNGNTRSNQ